jgi:hypothetical protein
MVSDASLCWTSELLWLHAIPFSIFLPAAFGVRLIFETELLNLLQIFAW